MYKSAFHCSIAQGIALPIAWEVVYCGVAHWPSTTGKANPNDATTKERGILNSRGREFENQGATIKKTLILNIIPFTSIHGGTIKKSLLDDLHGQVGLNRRRGSLENHSHKL